MKEPSISYCKCSQLDLFQLFKSISVIVRDGVHVSALIRSSGDDRSDRQTLYFLYFRTVHHSVQLCDRL